MSARLLSFERIAAAVMLVAAFFSGGNSMRAESGDIWKLFVPRVYSMQYAGDIGKMSVGAGWNYGKGKRWETHLFVGYLPKDNTPEDYWTFTLKEIFTPWKLDLSERVSISPLYVTLFVNSIFSDDFWRREPNRYPKGYYGFSSKVRFHIGFGHRFTFNHSDKYRSVIKKTTVYYEVSTCDLFIRQKFLNSYIPLEDILCFGFGLQWTI